MSIETVIVEGGIVSGVISSKPGIKVFKGIPYAAPPVESLRWRAPQPVIPWKGIRQADKFGPISVQQEQWIGSFYQKEFYPEPVCMSEDCLYINVWTPAKAMGDRLPVLMWIHGGGFSGGYGHEIEFDGEGFGEKGVILVTINYRLGILGFMAHPELTAESEKEVSGNYGILDQIAALKWIKNNIAGFGGDPDNITVFGQSAGALSVQTLISSQLTKGYINKAIMQSGGGIHALLDFLPLKDAEKIGIEFTEGLKTPSINELRKMSSEELQKNAMNFLITGGKGPLAFSPNVDGYIILEDTSEAIIKGKNHDIPYILGSTSDEMKALFKSTVDDFKMNAKVQYGKFAEKYLELCEDMINAQDFSDNSFAEKIGAGIEAWAELQEDQGRNPSYVYYFDRKLPGDDFGAFHSSELWYVFETLSRSWRPFDRIDYKLSSNMAEYWSNFAKTGNPNGNGLPIWTAYTKESPMKMEFGELIGMMETKGNPRSKFLKDFAMGKLD